MNESKKIDPRELSPLALAFVGDSVLELLVRQRLVEHHRLSAGKLNAEKVKYVSAKAQFREQQLLRLQLKTVIRPKRGGTRNRQC